MSKKQLKANTKNLMGRIIVFMIVQLMVFTVSCSLKPRVSRQENIDDLVNNGIVVDLNWNEQQLIIELGKPVKVVVKAIENNYYEFDDASIHYHYDGLEIIYYHHKHPEKGWKKISRIEVCNKDYKLKYGIRIGMHISEIYALFGSSHFPVWEEDGFKYLGYESTQSEHEQILFVMKEDYLTKVIWSNWP